MNVSLEVVDKDNFLKISEKIHAVCFKEERPKDFERFNFALVCSNEDRGMTAYSTILEFDAESAYMQNGGTFPDTPKFLTVKSYFMMVNWLKRKYPVITTRIFNYNKPMINMAMKAGFDIIGVESYRETPNYKGGTLLSLSMESDLYNG